MSAPTSAFTSALSPHPVSLPPLFIRNLAPPVANSALHERQFLLFVEARQAAKKPGKRRTSSEKNSATLAPKSTPFQLTPMVERYSGRLHE
jgi:hypothetical protein